MNIKSTIKKYVGLFCALFVAVMGLLMATPIRVKAETTEAGSPVLEDLEKAENFNATDYPANAKDYSLNVIQIAESKAGELLIYVYQPSGGARELVASSINISTSMEGDNPSSYRNYDLSLLNSEGVFYKYAVNDFTLKEDVLRFYSITAIYRPFDKEIDNGLYDDNTLEEMAYSVGQLWTATTYEGTPIYAVRYLELIKIESKHIGFIRYFDGGIFFPKHTDSHYVAFSTDHIIDDLLEVEMQYEKQVYTEIHSMNSLTGKTTVSSTAGAIESIPLTLTKYQIYEGGGDGIFAETYEYNRIQSVKDFCAKEELSAEVKAVVSEQEWVLRFAETDYEYRHLQTTQFESQYYCEFAEITGVVVFRLEFEYDGEIYNLGAVDNISRGDIVPDNAVTTLKPVGNTSLKDIVKDILDFGKIAEPQPWYERALRIGVVVVIAVALVVLLVFLVKLIVWLCRRRTPPKRRNYTSKPKRKYTPKRRNYTSKPKRKYTRGYYDRRQK